MRAGDSFACPQHLPFNLLLCSIRRAGHAPRRPVASQVSACAASTHRLHPPAPPAPHLPENYNQKSNKFFNLDNNNNKKDKVRQPHLRCAAAR